ncbi:ATV_HP_G0063000.mRNA.1.CDS.1 [Saccharomyces cerevisiae]|nr:ATV_HP_G0063000.mRNA.1.CDS.1 [Saccharomyces cerevisiae]CAI6999022.1 ATV_HP_G0063000.mRNA.1.CDS.1 [Saccharomyces cerevisiae]
MSILQIRISKGLDMLKILAREEESGHGIPVKRFIKASLDVHSNGIFRLFTASLLLVETRAQGERKSTKEER